MRLATLEYQPESGWSAPWPVELDSATTLVVVFGAPRYADDVAPLAALRAALPLATFLGCSTAGEIHQAKLLDDALVVAVVRFEHTCVGGVSRPVAADDDARGVGRALAADLIRPELRAVLVLSDGRVVNGSQLVRGLQDVLPPAVVVSGGLAADGTRFQRTWVLDGGQPRSGLVTAVGLYGSRVRVRHGSRGGWDRFGPERVVTRSRDNVLFELDGRPALQLYKEYLGERTAGLPATALLFPLALREAEGEHAYVRTILDIDEASQSMIFAGDVPVGARAQLMRANFDRLVQGAADAAEAAGPAGAALASAADGPQLSIAVSCVGRRLVLRGRTEEELEATLEHLPASTAQIGFYAYGEISPLTTGECELHNQTMTLTVLSES